MFSTMTMQNSELIFPAFLADDSGYTNQDSTHTTRTQKEMGKRNQIVVGHIRFSKGFSF